MLTQSYHMISPKEMAMVVDRKTMFLGYNGDQLVGFIGEHLEGSMGLLYVFPEFRRRGFAAALQRRLIARTMERGFVPFGQVEKDNLASLRLQEKLNLIVEQQHADQNEALWMDHYRLERGQAIRVFKGLPPKEERQQI